jgi:microcystin-dependent protein
MSYTKFKSAWSATDELTGEAWNHLESQWAEAKADIDIHQHDSRYYLKATADVTFFSTSFYTGFDADMVDGQHFADLLASVVPLGAIMIWSGTDANVPSGWHLCDGGTYGGKASPDLRDRFVIGAGDAYAVNATGGPAAWNGTITPTGTIAIGNHALTTAELPAHDHTFTEYSPPYSGQAYNYSPETYTNPNSSYTSTARTTDAMATGDGTHSHTGSTASIAAIDPRPLYYSLFYIMKYA